MTEQRNLEQQTRQLLNDSEQTLDAATLSRLNQARHKALQNPQQNRYRWPALTVVSSAAVLVLMVSLWPPSQGLSGLPSDAIEILSLADEDSLDLYEDLEFYEWLEYEEQNG